MIQARKLGHVVLKVRDAAKSKEFYMRTLGLQIAFEDSERGRVFLSCGREHHELALFELATGETPDMSQPGLHHMAWQLGSLEELRAAYNELKTMAIPIASTDKHNATSSLHIHDPDGNRVELYCDTVENGFETLRTLGSRRDRLDLEQEPFVNERISRG
jgi:catechol-2,3-dioxygenase